MQQAKERGGVKEGQRQYVNTRGMMKVGEGGMRGKCRDECSNSTIQLKGWGGETIQCVNQMTCKQASKHMNNKHSVKG